MKLALSTSWWGFSQSRIDKVFKEIGELGFEQAELGFSLTKKALEKITKLSRKSSLEIASLHNFCPIPDGLAPEDALPDCYSLASRDEDERKTAVFFTKQTIDYCRKLNAKAVVLHLGRVKMEDETRSLIQLYHEGLTNDTQYILLKEKMRLEREKEAEPYFAQALKSLKELSQYAQELNVALGVENRFYFREIPGFEEFKVIFEIFKNNNVFYWHDTGHARVAANLGFVNSEDDFLINYGARLIGMHLHDVKGCRDHLAPCRGELDFNKFKFYAGQSVIKVIEAHYPARREEIIKAKKHLEAIFS